jgi:putative tricarboxylic transport membrane protein
MINRVIAVFMLVLASVYAYGTSKLPSYEIGDPLGGKVFPYLLIIGLVLATILLLFETNKTRSRETSEREKEPRNTRKNLIVIGLVVFWTIIFIMLLEPMGFLLSTSIYLIVFMTYLNSKKLWLHIIVSVMFSVALYTLLVKGLGVTLAKGIVYF